MKSLAIVEEMKAIDIFKPDTVDDILGRIRKEVSGLEPDLSTAKGRKEIASMAYKVAQSKTLLDAAGKELVAGWKSQAKVVDEQRKILRDSLDEIRDEVRKPLTEWEAEEKARVEAEKLAIEVFNAHSEALEENDRFDILRKEAAEAEAARVEEEQRLLKEREEQIRKEAAEEERRRAAEEIAKKQREMEEAAKRAEEEKARAIQAAKEEEQRIQREIAERADREKRAAEEERRRAAEDKEHRRNVNNLIVSALVAVGLSDEEAKSVIRAAASGAIPHVTINY